MSRQPWSFEEKAQELKKVLAARNSGDGLQTFRVPFFGDVHTVGPERVTNNRNEEVTSAVAVLLMTWVLRDKAEPEDRPPVWIGFRECREAGPLMGYFQENTAKTLERSFEGQMDGLKAAALALGSEVVHGDPGFDLSLVFRAFPGLPVLLRFSDREDGMPASCQILFPESAQDRLDIRCLGVIGTWLTGGLIGQTGRLLNLRHSVFRDAFP